MLPNVAMTVHCLACGRGPNDLFSGQETGCLTCCPLDLSNNGRTLHRTGKAWGSRRILAAAEASPTAPSTPTSNRSAGVLPGSRPRSRNSTAVKSEIALECASVQASHTAAVPRHLFYEEATGRQHAQRRRGRKQAWSSQPSSQQPSPQKASNPSLRACGKELPVDSSSNAGSDVGVQQPHFDIKILGQQYSRMTMQGSSQETGHIGVLGYINGVDNDQQQHEQQQPKQLQPQPQPRPQSQPQTRPSSVGSHGVRIPRQGMDRQLKEIEQLGKFLPRSIRRTRSGSQPRRRLPPPGWEFPV